MQIHEIPESKVFLSICKENNLFIWGFEDGRDKQYQKFDLCRQVMTVIVSQY